MKNINYYAEYREKNRVYLNNYKKMWARKRRGSSLPVKFPSKPKKRKPRKKGFCYSCEIPLPTKKEIFCDKCINLFNKHHRS